MKTTVTSTDDYTAGYGASATGAVVSLFAPLQASNQPDPLAAANSPLYRTYCSLYEECKIIGMKVSISVVSAVGGSDIPSLQIYTAWDRKYGYGEAEMSASDIKNASTYAVATALNNNVAKLTRSCYASDLMEKATWFDATLDTAANGYRNLAWAAAARNPNMFHPGFYIFLNCPSLGATKAISMSVNVTYYFAFRNPRYGGAAGGNAKFVDLGPRPTLDDDDGDEMDDDKGDLGAPGDLDAGGDMDDDVFARQAAAAPAPVPGELKRKNHSGFAVSSSKKILKKNGK